MLLKYLDFGIVLIAIIGIGVVEVACCSIAVVSFYIFQFKTRKWRQKFFTKRERDGEFPLQSQRKMGASEWLGPRSLKPRSWTNMKTESSWSLKSEEVNFEAEKVRNKEFPGLHPENSSSLSIILLYLSHLPFPRHVYLDNDTFVCNQQRKPLKTPKERIW